MLNNPVHAAGGQFNGIPSDVIEVFSFSIRNYSFERVPFNDSLSVARWGLVSASAKTLVAFAGGMSAAGPSTAVDIFDVATQTWQVRALSAASLRAFGAGGERWIIFGQACENAYVLLL